MTLDETSIRHHFVPQWYQRGFLPQGKGEFYVLDKSPLTEVKCPDGKTRKLKNPLFIRRSGTNELFKSDHLYAVDLPFVSSDFLERYLFGTIDMKGSIADEMLLKWPITIPMPKGDEYPYQYGHPAQRMIDMIHFINVQKTRTLRGLDTIKHELFKLGILQADNNIVMSYFMDRSNHQCTVWSECHWQLFTIENEEDELLLSDDPVTFYNMDCYPKSIDCKYPKEPNPFWRGTRVIYPMSSKKLLVLSHKEHVDNPSRSKAKKLRRNARIYDQAILNFTSIENEKYLSHDEVQALNHVIKSRAVQYVASHSIKNLYPEKAIKLPKWSAIDDIFKPRFKSYHSQSEIHIGYEGGRSEGFNAYGEQITSKADEMKAQLDKILENKKSNS